MMYQLRPIQLYRMISAEPATSSANSPANPIERRSQARRLSRGDTGRLSPLVIVDVVRASDLLLLLVAGPFARLALRSLRAPWSDGQLLLATISGSVLTTFLLVRAHVYVLQSLCSVFTQLRLFAVPLLAGTGTLMVCLFLMGDEALPFREWPFVWLLISMVLLIASRCLLTRLLHQWSETGRLARRVAVVGVGDFSREFIARLRAEPQAYTIVGLYDDRLSRVPAEQEGVEVRGTVNDLLKRSRQERIDVIAVALPLSAVNRIAIVLEQIGSAVADLCLTTDLAGLRYTGAQFSAVGSNPVVLIKEQPLKNWRAAKKFAFDTVLGSLILLGLLPFLALIAVLIRLDSSGPVLFRQPRLGFNNRLFTCYKFRTMHHSMADLMANQQTTRDDPRVTRIGKWLRRFSIDELPQLLNVLQGNMSLVGPRPHAPHTKAADRLFTEIVAKYAVRHRVKPGITGWAQVNGWRGETKTLEEIENRVACDLSYIENWSIRFDLRILMLTIVREILSRNAF
jgi:polysaccharide biosynthesis protein PslA